MERELLLRGRERPRDLHAALLAEHEAHLPGRPQPLRRSGRYVPQGPERVTAQSACRSKKQSSHFALPPTARPVAIPIRLRSVVADLDDKWSSSGHQSGSLPLRATPNPANRRRFDFLMDSLQIAGISDFGRGTARIFRSFVAMTPNDPDDDAERLVSLADYESAAARALHPGALAYYAGGAGAELTLADNAAAWQRLAIVPRALAGVGRRDPAITLLGHRRAHPLLTAPTAFHALGHRDAELATAGAPPQSVRRSPSRRSRRRASRRSPRPCPTRPAGSSCMSSVTAASAASSSRRPPSTATRRSS